MTVLKKEPEASKRGNHGTIRLATYAAKIIMRIFISRRLKRKLRTYLEKISLYLEEKEELEMQLGCHNELRT
jgi:hypothetical protein